MTTTHPTTPDQGDERRAFETFAANRGMSLLMHPTVAGAYDSPLTQFAWIGYREGASAQPVAQGAEDTNNSLYSVLAECRDAFPMPERGSDLERLWAQAMGDPYSVPDYIKAALAASPVPPSDTVAQEAITGAHWQKIGDVIALSLEHYRCATIGDASDESGSGLPLADAFCQCEGTSMETAKHELEMLCDHILLDLHAAALAAPQPSQGANVKVGGSTVYVTNNHRRESNRWWATVYPGFDDDDKRVSTEECDAIANWIADSLNAAPHPPVSAEAGKVEWVDGQGGRHAVTIPYAAELLKQLFDEWPDGVNEIEAALRWRDREIARLTSESVAVSAAPSALPAQAMGEKESVEPWVDGNGVIRTGVLPDAPQEASKPAPKQFYIKNIGGAFDEREEIPASKEAGKVEPVADERQPSDGDYLRWAEQAGAKINWDFESASSARVVFLTASQWGRFCDKVRALHLRPSQQALSDQDLDLLWLEHRPPGVSNEEQYRCAFKFARAVLALAGSGGKE